MSEKYNDYGGCIIVLTVLVGALAYFTASDDDAIRKRLTAIETQLLIDANCIATLEVLQQAREQAEQPK